MLARTGSAATCRVHSLSVQVEHVQWEGCNPGGHCDAAVAPSLCHATCHALETFRRVTPRPNRCSDLVILQAAAVTGGAQAEWGPLRQGTWSERFKFMGRENVLVQLREPEEGRWGAGLGSLGVDRGLSGLNPHWGHC